MMTPTTATVTFWGAAHSVTGSFHLVEAQGRCIVLDCGVSRNRRGGPQIDPSQLPVDPHHIDALVLSHAHIDHCGNLPNLVRRGFDGPIYCTPATRDLLGLILDHSARLHEEDARAQAIVGTAAEPPRSTHEDVAAVLELTEPVEYGEPIAIFPEVELTLSDAGHILGSAAVALALDGPRPTRIVFTGDLGRRGSPLWREPAPLPCGDLLVSESTYGGRSLDTPRSAATQLEEVVRRTVERDGKVLIPAFSLGRTQVIVHVLQQAIRAGRIPEVPVHIDGRSAVALAAVHRQYADLLRPEAVRLAGDDLFAGPPLHYVGSADESLDVATRRGPRVIIAPSGMCEGGRIVQHLKSNIDDPRSTVVLVNYQAPNTPGRQLLERGPTVRLHGKKVNKWADVVYLAGFSGHADHDDLLALLGPLAGGVGMVRLVHGESEQAAALGAALREHGFRDVSAPARGDRVEL